MRHEIDIVGRARADGMSAFVKGEVAIECGSDTLDNAVRDVLRKAALEIAVLVGAYDAPA